MTAKNRADTQTEINSLLNTSGSGDISAADVRATAETAKDSNLNLLETGDQSVASTINAATINAEQSRIGLIDYNDAFTSGTPIVVTGGAGFVPLTNNGAGPGTNKTYKVTGVGELWDVATNLFTWDDGLELGDQVLIRLNIIATTTTVNQTVGLKLVVGIGGTPVNIFWDSNYYKTSGVQDPIAKTSLVYMGDLNTINNGARFEVESDANATIEVIGWAITHFVRN